MSSAWQFADAGGAKRLYSNVLLQIWRSAARAQRERSQSHRRIWWRETRFARVRRRAARRSDGASGEMIGGPRCTSRQGSLAVRQLLPGDDRWARTEPIPLLAADLRKKARSQTVWFLRSCMVVWTTDVDHAIAPLVCARALSGACPPSLDNCHERLGRVFSPHSRCTSRL